MRKPVFLFLLFINGFLWTQELEILRTTLDEVGWSPYYPEVSLIWEPDLLEPEPLIEEPLPVELPVKEYPYSAPTAESLREHRFSTIFSEESGWLISGDWMISELPLELKAALGSGWDEPQNSLSFYTAAVYKKNSDLHFSREVSYQKGFLTAGIARLGDNPLNFMLKDQWLLDSKPRFYLSPYLFFGQEERGLSLDVDFRNDAERFLSAVESWMPLGPGIIGLRFSGALGQSDPLGVFPQLSYRMEGDKGFFAADAGFHFPENPLFMDYIFMYKKWVDPYNGKPSIAASALWGSPWDLGDIEIALELGQGVVPFLKEDRITWIPVDFYSGLSERFSFADGNWGLELKQDLLLNDPFLFALDTRLFLHRDNNLFTLNSTKSYHHLLDVYQTDLWYNGLSYSRIIKEDWSLIVDIQLLEFLPDYISVSLSYKG